MSEEKPSRESKTCMSQGEKTIGQWVLIFPLAIVILLLIGFLYELSIVSWDFTTLSWYSWVVLGFLVAGILAFFVGLICISKSKKCPQ